MRVVRTLFGLYCTLLGCCTLRGDSTITGGNGALTLTSSSALEVLAAKRVTLKNLTIRGLEANRLVMRAPHSKLVLDNSTLLLSGNYTFSQGSLEIVGNCSIKTSATFDTVFTMSGHLLFITKNSRLTVGAKTTLNYQPASKTRRIIRFADRSATLCLESATFKNSNALGIIFQTGSFEVKGTSIIDSTTTSTEFALTLGGAATADGDCLLLFEPDSRLVVKKSGIVVCNKGVKAVRATGISATIDVQDDAHFLIKNPATFDSTRLKIVSGKTVFGGEAFVLGSESSIVLPSRLSGSLGLGSILSGGLSTVLSTSEADGRVAGLHMSPNGEFLAVGIFPDTSDPEFRVIRMASPGVFGTPVGSFSPQEVTDVDWSPDGKEILVTEGNPGNQANCFALDSTGETAPSLVLKHVFNFGVGSDGLGFGGHWSPDGRRFAIIKLLFSSASNPTLRLYSWDGAVAKQADAKDAGSAGNLSWSPGGNYLAVGVSASPTQGLLRIYEVDEETGLINEVDTKTLTGTSPGDFDLRIVFDVDWSPDGNFIALATNITSSQVQIYRVRDGIASDSPVVIQGFTGSEAVYAARWSRTGDKIALGKVVGTEDTLSMYRFDGTLLSQIDSENISFERVRSLDWSLTDSFLLFGTDRSAGGNELQSRNIAFSSQNPELVVTGGTTRLEGEDVRLDSMKLRLS